VSGRGWRVKILTPQTRPLTRLGSRHFGIFATHRIDSDLADAYQ
jgi:hypothetical protein